MRVFINPTYSGPDRGDGGIRRVTEAQAQHLPAFGWDIAGSPEEADLIVNHGASLVERPGVPMIAACHGLYWEDYQFGGWGDVTNARVIEVMARAQAITAPSRWVAHAITRGMLASPEVIYHGVDADAWAADAPHGGYVLWNKARVDAVSDPRDMQALAARLPDVPFVSTFGQAMPNVQVTGPGTFDQMQPIVQRAALYLATARETFGIGTLEALAAGVPVVGWDYGGQHEIIQPGETGILVPFGDLAALADAVRRALADRMRLSANARADARERWAWPDKIAQYAALYDRVLADWRRPRPKVSVIVTTYNLSHFLNQAIKSVVDQTMPDWECLVIDDCSADHPSDVVQRFVDGTPLRGKVRYHKTPKNLGLAGARNYGFAHANGTYVLFLDADDLLAPNALDTLTHALDADPGIHIAYGSLETMDRDGGNRKRNPWPAGQFNWHGQIAHLNQIHGACLMRREVLARSGGYRRRDWRAEDAAFWSRVTSFGFRAAKVTEDTIQIYRMHPDQKSRAEDGDGDWTAWLPWRLAHDAHSGVQAMRQNAQPNARIVPFGAQGTPPAPLKAWPVRHHAHPIVSVIIPVGPGHAAYLVDALDSVQAQTLPEWECVVVDDSGGQVDTTAHPWTRVLHIGQGHGAGEARNEGLKMARAPLVLFLDADDVLLPRALEVLLKGYASSGGKYAYSDWLSLEDERRIDGGMEAHEVAEYSQAAMLRKLLHAVSALVPAAWVRAVGGFDEALPVFEDWHLFGKLAASGYCGVRVPEPLLIYRHGSGTRTRAALKARAAGEPVAYTELGERAIAAIADRFAPFISGEEPLMGCCGGNAATVAQAEAALGDMVSFATAGAIPAPAPVVTNGHHPVRMEFIGAQQGAQTFYGRGSKLPYRAGREPGARFHDVDARDVEHFVNLGLFRIVATPDNTAEEMMAAVQEPRESRVKGRQG